MDLNSRASKTTIRATQRKSSGQRAADGGIATTKSSDMAKQFWAVRRSGGSSSISRRKANDLKTTTTTTNKIMMATAAVSTQTQMQTTTTMDKRQVQTTAAALLWRNKFKPQVTWVRLSSSSSSSSRGSSRRRALLAPPSMSRRAIVCCSYLATMLMFLLLCTTLTPFQGAEAIKLQPEGREKFYWSGEQFVITCQNNNNIKNVKIRWLGPNGQDITEDRSQRVHAESTGPHGHRLVVMNATATIDDGQYKCTLGSTDDRSPREHIEFNLKIYKTPSFRGTKRHLVLTAGQPGTLNCQVEFDPSVLSASVSWVRDSKPIEMFNDSAYTAIDYDASRQLSQLQVSPVTRQHDGVYTCRAVAVTSQLSKISDHDIHLETNYAPIFEQDSQTVWVDRGRAWTGPSGSRSNVYAAAHPAAANSYAPTMMRPRHGKPHHSPPGGNYNSNNNNNNVSSTVTTTGSTAAQGPQMVRVELRCMSQANPPASHLWVSSVRPSFVLAKGGHVLEEPHTEIDGHNTTSVLVIGYQLEPDWPHRDDSYSCSASNKLGTAAKTFAIKQGDPPPAFDVGPHRHYDPLTSQFEFTLMGPNFDPQSSAVGASRPLVVDSSRQVAPEIVPPVDAFRIRAESASSASGSGTFFDAKFAGSRRGGAGAGGNQMNGDATAGIVQLSTLTSAAASAQSQQQGGFMNKVIPASLNDGPFNCTISLSRLPSGNQRLYLEAHNAVGWSPNATYLGDYYIVSGAASSFLSAAQSGGIQLLVLSLVASSFLMLGSLVAQSPTRRQQQL